MIQDCNIHIYLNRRVHILVRKMHMVAQLDFYPRVFYVRRNVLEPNLFPKLPILYTLNGNILHWVDESFLFVDAENSEIFDDLEFRKMQ